MPYRLNVERRPGYHYFFVTGTDDFGTSIAYAREVFDLCRREGVGKALVEEDLEGDLSLAEKCELANQIARLLAESPRLRIAFLDRRAEQWEGNRFLETAATNRGVNGRLFRDAADAEAWLTSEAPPDPGTAPS